MPWFISYCAITSREQKQHLKCDWACAEKAFNSTVWILLMPGRTNIYLALFHLTEFNLFQRNASKRLSALYIDLIRQLAQINQKYSFLCLFLWDLFDHFELKKESWSTYIADSLYILKVQYLMLVLHLEFCLSFNKNPVFNLLKMFVVVR